MTLFGGHAYALKYRYTHAHHVINDVIRGLAVEQELIWNVLFEAKLCNVIKHKKLIQAHSAILL